MSSEEMFDGYWGFPVRVAIAENVIKDANQ